MNRLFSAVDMFPTTLAALGVEIPGDRLGIGTNLFSEQPTIMKNLDTNSFILNFLVVLVFMKETLSKEQTELLQNSFLEQKRLGHLVPAFFFTQTLLLS
jgi:phosphoglycerol transferase